MTREERCIAQPKVSRASPKQEDATVQFLPGAEDRNLSREDASLEQEARQELLPCLPLRALLDRIRRNGCTFFTKKRRTIGPISCPLQTNAVLLVQKPKQHVCHLDGANPARLVHPQVGDRPAGPRGRWYPFLAAACGRWVRASGMGPGWNWRFSTGASTLWRAGFLVSLRSGCL